MSAASLPATPQINHITGRIITAAMKVHTELGPGLLESAYHACLLHELRKQGLRVASQVGLPVVYDGEKIDLGYRIDLIVCDAVLVEIKCVEAINPIHQAQLLSYLRLSEMQVGLLINFHVLHLRDGIRRLVDGYAWQNQKSPTQSSESDGG
jgi:GxxExxY protein